MNENKVCLSSLFGIFQTALIVGVLSEALIIPPEEKRILALIEKQRLDKIRQNAAASLIQWSWRVYKYVYLGLVQHFLHWIRKSKILNQELARRSKSKGLKDLIGRVSSRGERAITMKYADALLRWTQVKDSFSRFSDMIFFSQYYSSSISNDLKARNSFSSSSIEQRILGRWYCNSNTSNQ